MARNILTSQLYFLRQGGRKQPQKQPKTKTTFFLS